MTSPDAIALERLALVDRDADDLVARATQLLSTLVPGLVLRAGRTEVALLEAQALVAVETIFALNRLPQAVAIRQAALAGVVRSEGAYATASVTVTMADSAGHTLPAGTRLRLVTGTDPVTFALAADLVVPPGSTSGTGAVTASTVGIAANGVAIGTPLSLLDSVFYVDAVTLATTPTGGADPEGVDEWLARAGQRFARLSSVLVLPAHFVAAALEDVRVSRARVVDRYDPTIGTGVPGDHLGHVTVAVSGSGGAALSGPVKAEIRSALAALTRADLAVHVVDPTITSVAVTVTVTALPDFTAAAVVANVTAALTAYLSPDTWGWGSTVYRNELIALIDGAAGVDRVVSLSVPAADVALSGVAPLASAGAISVTVS